MINWWWLIVAYGLGVLTVGLPVLLWCVGWARAWDRAWG